MTVCHPTDRTYAECELEESLEVDDALCDESEVVDDAGAVDVALAVVLSVVLDAAEEPEDAELVADELELSVAEADTDELVLEATDDDAVADDGAVAVTIV